MDAFLMASERDCKHDFSGEGSRAETGSTTMKGPRCHDPWGYKVSTLLQTDMEVETSLPHARPSKSFHGSLGRVTNSLSISAAVP